MDENVCHETAQQTELIDVAVTFETCILEELGSNIGRDIPQYHSKIPVLGHAHFLSDPLPFNINQSSYTSALCSLHTDSVII